MPARLNPMAGPTRERVSRMARKRDYGSGCLIQRGRGWAIRWRELEIAPDGSRKIANRCEALGQISKRQASDILAQRLAASGQGDRPMRSRVRFDTVAAEWERTVLP